MTPKDLKAIEEHNKKYPITKCAIEGCNVHRQDAWDAIHYTPAPEDWKCKAHEVVEI